MSLHHPLLGIVLMKDGDEEWQNLNRVRFVAALMLKYISHISQMIIIWCNVMAVIATQLYIRRSIKLSKRGTGGWRMAENEELIPKLQVLDDMYADKGVVSMAARDYYYEHYADEAERKRMDVEDIVSTIIGAAIVIGILLFGATAVVVKLVGGYLCTSIILK